MAKPNKLPETITWKASNQTRSERGTTWYLTFAIISLLFLAFAIYSKSIITIVTFVLIIAVVYLLGLQTPKQITCRIGKTGVTVGQVEYSYQTIKTFWILYNPPELKTLNLLTTAYLNNQIVIQLGNQDPMLVKLVLNQYLPEDLEREESLTEALARRLKI